MPTYPQTLLVIMSQNATNLNEKSASSLKKPRIQLHVVFPFKQLPCTSRPAWFSIQNVCPDLHRVCAYLKQGTRPSKKLTNIKDVERCLSVTSISKDGLRGPCLTVNLPLFTSN